VNLGLVRLEPGRDPGEVARHMRAVLPSRQVRVLTRAAIEGQETRFWLFHKSIGIMFLLGVAVACVVGVVVVFQVLSSDIAEHFAEYATLKAIGRTGLDVARVVVSQALLLAVAAYIPSLAAAFVLYRVTSRVVLLPLRMDATIALTVFVLANLICAVSAVVSVRKLETADPADLF
jgi:putative ABC transport system permease protein